MFLWNQWLKKVSRPRRIDQGLAFLRFFTGVYFFYQGYLKLTNPLFSPRLAGQLQQWAEHNPIFFYQDFLHAWVIPNSATFATLVTYGELAVGVSLMLGFLVSTSTLLAIFLSLNYLMASQHTHPSLLGINLAFILNLFTLFWTEAGRSYGIDSLLFSTQASPPQKAKASKSKQSRIGVKPTSKSPKKGNKAISTPSRPSKKQNNIIKLSDKKKK